MRDVVADVKLVGRCGLYCGACRAYLKGKCRGCAENVKATWCKVRACCEENGYATCADCWAHADPKECRKFHNVISRVIGFVLRSDRPACIARIREVGLEAYAQEMAARRTHSLSR